MNPPPSPRAGENSFRGVLRGSAFLHANSLVRRLLAVCLLLHALPGSASADPVYWGSQGFFSHSENPGDDRKGGFTLRIGVFRQGFQPTPDNVDEWPAQWIGLGVAAHHAEDGRFAGVVDDSAALPDGAARQVYFWAGKEPGPTKQPEWLLVTDPTWLWAGQAFLPPIPKTWVADEAALVIAGQVADGNAELRSVAVRTVSSALTAVVSEAGQP